MTSLRDPTVIERYRQVGIETTPRNLEQTRQSVSERLALVDGMRMEVFGRAR